MTGDGLARRRPRVILRRHARLGRGDRPILVRCSQSFPRRLGTYPVGADPHPEGVNFSIHSADCDRIELLMASVLKDFYELWAERFSNKTNGVTPRRFLALSNPGLRTLLDRTLGEGWLTDLGRLRGCDDIWRVKPVRVAGG